METRPNHTVYINNLNEKVKKEGEFITSAPKYQMFMTRFIYQIWVDMMSFNLPACRSHQRTPFRRTPGTSSSWPDTWQSRVKPRTFVWIVKGMNSRMFNDEKSENTIHFAILFHEVFDMIGTGKNFIFVPGAENAPHLLELWVKSNTFWRDIHIFHISFPNLVQYLIYSFVNHKVDVGELFPNHPRPSAFAKLAVDRSYDVPGRDVDKC